MNLNGEFIAFFLLSTFAIGGAVFMIHMTKVVHMALSLAFTFFSLAGIYFLLNAEYLAVIQILIYAGAITIMMLFGIMLTDSKETKSSRTQVLWQSLSFGIVALFFALGMSIFYRAPLGNSDGNGTLTVADIGNQLFGRYVIPFELASVLLLVAFIGAIILARREKE